MYLCGISLESVTGQVPKLVCHHSLPEAEATAVKAISNTSIEEPNTSMLHPALKDATMPAAAKGSPAVYFFV